MSQAFETRPLLLVVDDDRDTSHALCLMLQRTGYRVAAAFEPYEANSMVQELLPDGVVLDLNMPAGGGRRFFDWMLANNATARIPVIVYSAQADRETQAELLAMGARAFVDKASPPDVLIATLVSIVGYVPPPERKPAAPAMPTYDQYAGQSYPQPSPYGQQAPGGGLYEAPPEQATPHSFAPPPFVPHEPPAPSPPPPGQPPPPEGPPRPAQPAPPPRRPPPSQGPPRPSQPAPPPRRPPPRPHVPRQPPQPGRPQPSESRPAPPGAVPYPYARPDAAPPEPQPPPPPGVQSDQKRRLQEQLRVQYEMQQQPHPQHRPQERPEHQIPPQPPQPPEGQAPPPPASAAADPPSGTGGEGEQPGKAVILLVDDSPDERFALAVRLRRKGYTVMQASNSHVALELARVHQPDVVLTDIHMPGISGLQLCHTLTHKRETEHIPVFLMSGLPQSISKKELDRVGGSGFFEKPIDLNLLLVLLESRGSRKKTAAIQGFTSEALGRLDEIL